MTLQLTETQAETLRNETASPVTVRDPFTDTVWYLVSASDYGTVQEILEDERQQKAIRAVGLRNVSSHLSEAP